MTCLRANDVKIDSRIPAALPAAKAVHFPGQQSPGTIAGIVIGCMLAVSILVGAGWWFWRKQSNISDNGDKEATTMSQTQAETDTQYQLDGKEGPNQLDSKERPVQLDGSQRAEMGHQDLRPELSGSIAAQELQGSTPIFFVRPSDNPIPRGNSAS